jgi:TPR repeat protein
MSGGVFICYRREETAFAARAIYDRVAQKVGRENVFLDVDNIELGVDWFDALNERVAACDALVAVIGRNWVSGTDKDGGRRLDDPDDFVRIEIEAALKRGVRVIPILVDGALMPKAGDLPESLKGLARRQNIEISHIRFEADVDKLTGALASIMEALSPRIEAAAHAAETRGPSRLGSAEPPDDEALAERGDPAAQTRIGDVYCEGNGVERDYAKAMEWFQKAAYQGDLAAQTKIGDLYLNGHGVKEDNAKGLEWQRKAADEGYAKAQVALGDFYYSGQDGRQDHANAMKWYRKAADRGDAQGLTGVGNVYSYGKDAKDKIEAMKWYRKAIDKGEASAQWNVGVIYELGVGVERDYAKAMEWYLKAADQGYDLAMYYIGNFYRFGDGAEQDYAKAVEWYRQAGDHGYGVP